MNIGKSILDQAFKLYAKWCEQNGVVYQQPYMVEEAEFYDSLKFENMSGTLIEFEVDETGKLHIQGTTRHEKIVEKSTALDRELATETEAVRGDKKAARKPPKKAARRPATTKAKARKR